MYALSQSKCLHAKLRVPCEMQVSVRPCALLGQPPNWQRLRVLPPCETHKPVLPCAPAGQPPNWQRLLPPCETHKPVRPLGRLVQPPNWQRLCQCLCCGSLAFFARRAVPRCTGRTYVACVCRSDAQKW